ncbi:hypothetical protein N7532_008376 [Penicillium argentinense]|uniref:Uncharacterized protein n=1 Tax=Penicillium argentinense TaxID=1131581 RepID=A0A9W9EXC4_9EURO|nr:uncharacterized protein N7532_008376 [Penicillium argentinense]KAJ5089692.1 hypothetical protein N7532_008376 [Penicillium argentinense]
MLQIDPVQRVFLNFYAAISYELLGQTAHLYSSTKISLLNTALDCFAECAIALPQPIPLPKLPKIEKSPASPPPRWPTTPPRTPRQNLALFDGGFFNSPGRDSLVRSITRLIDVTMWDLDDDVFIDDAESRLQTPFTLALSPLAKRPATRAEKDRLFRIRLSPTRKCLQESPDPVKPKSLMPSPLRVSKARDTPVLSVVKPKEVDSSSSQNRNSIRPRPPPLPLRIIPASELNIDRQKQRARKPPPSSPTPDPRASAPRTPPKKTKQPEEPAVEPADAITPSSAAKNVRYNRGIEILRSQITSNITSIQEHVDHVSELQRSRRSRKMQRSISFWSFDPIKSHEDENEKKYAEPVLDQFGNILVKETKEERIARLRSEGWKTVGLRSPRATWKGARYYQEFCAMVMSEMTLDQ